MILDRRHALKWSVMLCLSLAAAGCGDDGQSRSGGTLVYEEYPNSTVGRIVRVAGDGTNRKVLWEGGPHISSLYPSPDGRSILFADYTTSQWYLLPASGGAPAPMAVPVFGSTYPIFPVWAPDGTAIAWIIANPDTPEIRRVAIAPPGSGTGQLISPDTLDVAWTDWSTDSQQLVICARTASANILYVLDRDGGNLHAITTDAVGVECRQAWKPSARIAFAGGGLYTVGSDGSNLTQVMLNPSPGAVGFVGPVFWSPDGHTLAATDDHNFLWPVDAQSGANLRTVERATESNPWSPDGDFLLFLSDTIDMQGNVPVARSTVGVMRADGTEKRTVTPGTVNSYLPAWIPGPS